MLLGCIGTVHIALGPRLEWSCFSKFAKTHTDFKEFGLYVLSTFHSKIQLLLFNKQWLIWTEKFGETIKLLHDFGPRNFYSCSTWSGHRGENVVSACALPDQIDRSHPQ